MGEQPSDLTWRPGHLAFLWLFLTLILALFLLGSVWPRPWPDLMLCLWTVVARSVML